MGWQKKSGVQITDYLTYQINQLADLLPFNIVVTSGLRNAREQARAMLNNKKKYDQMAQDGVVRSANPKIPYTVNYLVDLYYDDQFAWAVNNTYPQSPAPWTESNLQAATAAVQDYYDRGGGKHNIGLAFDLSYAHNQGSPRDWINNTDLAKIESAANQLGFIIDREFDHFHIEVPPGQVDTKKNALLGILLLGGLIWISKK